MSRLLLYPGEMEGTDSLDGDTNDHFEILNLEFSKIIGFFKL